MNYRYYPKPQKTGVPGVSVLECVCGERLELDLPMDGESYRTLTGPFYAEHNGHRMTAGSTIHP